MTNFEEHFDEIVNRFEFFKCNFPDIQLETVMILAISSVEVEHGGKIEGANKEQRLVSLLELLKEPSGKNLPNG